MKMTALEKLTLGIAPRWTLSRVRSRLAVETFARHYEAAEPGRRTSSYRRDFGDANAVTLRALTELRLHSRDLVRNNAWASQGLEVITGNTVGWGFGAKPISESDTLKKAAATLWKQWAETKQIDADETMNFAAIQELVLRTIAESGECLIRKRPRRATDGLAIPLQIQVLEPDYLDTAKDNLTAPSGGRIIQGVEFDRLGTRVAYWLFDAHPGSTFSSSVSKRYAASEIIHCYRPLRPGQVRGVTWFAQTIAPIKDFDEYEDATLMKQKVAACFAAFVSDVDGVGPSALAPQVEDGIEQLEPGQVTYLQPGRQVTFGTPPMPAPDGFDVRTLRRIAAGLGITYEDLTGDFSQVNFSSARMSRLKHYQNVHKWRHNMLIPQLCDGVWAWAMQAAVIAGLISEVPGVEWSTPPMPMIEPDKEGTAYKRLIRTGLMTLSDAVRERGGDPDTHFEEYAADNAKLDALKIKLDSDPRAVSDAGQAQQSGAPAGQAPG